MRIDEIFGFGKANVNDQIAYQTKKYLKPFLQQWQGMLVTQAQAGVDTNSPAIQQQLLAKLISKYASLRKQDVPIIKSMMLQGDLSDITYVSTIADRAIQSSLMKRAAGGIEVASPAPAAPPAAGAPPAPPAARVIKTGSQRKASDGQMYRIVRLRDGSREWHDLTGNRAVDTIQQELGRKYGV